MAIFVPIEILSRRGIKTARRIAGAYLHPGWDVGNYIRGSRCAGAEDKREQSEAMIDSSCRVIDGRLSCSRPVRTGSYTMWVVPEYVARDIGPEALASAATGGLRTSRTAELPWVQE